MARRIALLPGDGIGPEVMVEVKKVLRVLNDKAGLKAELSEAACGGHAIDLHGHPLPKETLELCLSSDAVLLGAVGGPRWAGVDFSIRPETAVLSLRKELGLYANLRPTRLYPPLLGSCPLKEEIASGVDILIVRELTGGLYYGEPRGVVKGEDGSKKGINTMIYSEDEIRRVASLAFEAARGRRKKLTSVDKANVLETMKLWRDVVQDVGRDYQDVELNHMYVDNCSMQLILNPLQFDVILAENLFGDLLTDEASALAGSIGMQPSASIGGKIALYEPIHGSAPDIAGRGVANPIGAILSAAMMLSFSFSLEREAECLENSMLRVLEKGYRTRDIYQEGTRLAATHEMGDLIAEELDKVL